MSICKHFGSCGGCSFQDIPYKTQLYQKEEKVKKLLSLYGIDAELAPINSYSEWFYRNKMEFTFGLNNEVILGLYKKGSKREIMNIDECLIFSPHTYDILKTVREFAFSNNYSTYNKFSYYGFLRNLIVRETKYTNEIMVGIVTTNKEQLDKDGFVTALTSLKLKSSLKSIYWVINNSRSDAIVFEKKELLYGEPFIQENLNGLKFNIGVDSFFQTNSTGIKNLYTKISSYANLKNNERVLDLFCGMGCIGIFLSKYAKFVWGVETQQEAVAAAWENAKANSIENISLFTSDTRRFLNSQGTFYKGVDVLVINPPRPGISNKIIRAILRLEPKLIFYSSCNPTTLFRDIKALLGGYSIDFIELFDLFPHTPHLECLSVLRKKIA
jgi:23S rRNA (uracil1939-C5)-methyltransferase